MKATFLDFVYCAAAIGAIVLIALAVVSFGVHPVTTTFLAQ